MYQRKSVKRILKAIRPQKSLKELNWLDVFVLTAILFGNAIYTSTMQWIASLSATECDRSSGKWSAILYRSRQLVGIGQSRKTVFVCLGLFADSEL